VIDVDLQETAGVKDIHKVVDVLQATPSGQWIDGPLASDAFRVDGIGNSWVYLYDIRNGISWSIVGRTMFLNVFLAVTTTLATAQNIFYLKVPGGYTLDPRSVGDGNPKNPARTSFSQIYAADGAGVTNIAFFDACAIVTPDFIRIYKTDGSNWTAGATYIIGQIVLEVTQRGELA